MKTTNVTIAGRTFPVGELTLGPVWDNEEGFAHINRPRNAEKFFDKQQFEGWMLTVYHSIDHANVQPPITLEQFRALLRTLPMSQAVSEISEAFVIAVTGSAFEKGNGEGGATGEVKADSTAASSAPAGSADSTA
jgi:hypothetical protein